MRALFACLAPLLLLAAPAPGDPARAAALWKEYRSLGGDGLERRENILFALRDLGDAGRPYLMRALEKPKRPIEYILAQRFTKTGIRTAEHLDAALAGARRLRKEEPLMRFLGEALTADVRDWILAKGLMSTDALLLGASCRAAGTLRLKEAAPPLEAVLTAAVRSPSKRRIAYEAAWALCMLDGQNMVRLGRHRVDAVRLAASRILASRRKPNADERSVMEALLSDESWRVRRQAVIALGNSKNLAFGEALVEVLERDPRLACRASAQRSLREMSSKDFDYDASTWRLWLKDRSVEAGAPKAERKYSFVRYYGHSIVADNVCFIVDLSGSMRDPRRLPRIQVAKRELIRALEQLPRKTRFGIVVFSNDATSWKRRPVEATPARIAAAKAWIETSFRTGGRTNTWAALQAAFDSSDDLDTIFLLSDGNATRGTYEYATGVGYALFARNWERQVVVHSVCLSLSDYFKKAQDWGENFLSHISSVADGDCVIVRKDPGG